MKKVLLATTALVMTAGMASAEVKLKGFAVMSILGGSGYDDPLTLGVDEGDARFQSNVDVEFHMSTETDSGLSFGAKIDLDEATLTSDANEAVWVSGAFGKVTMGDTDSAIDWANAEAIQGANLADDFTIHKGAFANFLDENVDNTIVRYEYAMGDFGFAASVEDSAARDMGWSVGATYNMAISGGSIKLGIGYQDVPTYTGSGLDASVAAISAKLSLDSGLTAVAEIAQIDNYTAAGDADQFGIGLEYTSGAITVGASYGEIDAALAAADVESYGIGAQYDLGGGASLFAGMISEETGGAGSLDKYQAGVMVNF